MLPNSLFTIALVCLDKQLFTLLEDLVPKRLCYTHSGSVILKNISHPGSHHITLYACRIWETPLNELDKYPIDIKDAAGHPRQGCTSIGLPETTVSGDGWAACPSGERSKCCHVEVCSVDDLHRASVWPSVLEAEPFSWRWMNCHHWISWCV